MTILSSFLLATVLIAADEADATTYTLAPEVKAGRQTHNRIHLTVRGRIRANKAEESVAGQALIEFDERVQDIGQDGLPSKVVRVYRDGRAKFIIGAGEDTRQLRREVRFLVGDKNGSSLQLWSPGGPLTTDERELIEDVIDVTRLEGLLPHEPVAVGQSWEPTTEIVNAVCDFDNFIGSTVKCTLASVADGKATVQVSGIGHGLTIGTEVKSKIEAMLTMDVKSGLVEKVQWTQTDGRAAGPVSPAGAYEVKIQIDRSIAQAKELSDESLANVTLEAPKGATVLAFTHPDKPLRLYLDRDWHVTTLRPDVAVLRRLKDSSLVGQLNVQILGDRKPGTMMSPEEFQAVVEKAADGKIEGIGRADDLPTDGSYHLRLVEATAVVDDIKLIQRHYLVTTPQGKQAVFSFVTEPENVEALGTADLELVSAVEFLQQQTAGTGSASPK